MGLIIDCICMSISMLIAILTPIGILYLSDRFNQ